MICRRSLHMKVFAALGASVLIACNDAPTPTSPRKLAAGSHAAGDVITSPVIQYSLGSNVLFTFSPTIQSVSDGLAAGAVATVPPGATIAFTLSYLRSYHQECFAPCQRVIFLAYTAAGLPPVSGLLDTFDASVSDNAEVSIGVTGQTTAPTTPGTYFIGLRMASGSTPDNGAGVTGTDTDASDGQALEEAAAIKVVVVPMPLIGVTVTGTQGTNGWYTSSDVKVDWTVTDPSHTLDGTTGCVDATISNDVITTLTCFAKGALATNSKLVTIKHDATPPVLTGSVSPNPVVFNTLATATPVASDAGSGLTSPASCDPVNTSVAGNFTVKCRATDLAGNMTTIDVPYTVTGFSFSGFQNPIKSDPTAWNSAKAGSAVPLTFSLGGNQGMKILAAGSPTVRFGSCPGQPSSPVTEVKASGPGLEYEGNGVYTFVWKTDKAWSGKCATFVLELIDGVEHTANFQFK